MERPLRLRTITYFLSDASEEGIAAGAAFLQAAQQMYEDEGYVVQTTRIAAPQRHASQPLPELTASIKELEGWAAGRRVKFVNIGPLLDPEAFDKVPHILRDTRHVSCSVALPRRLTPKMALGAAKCILELASMTDGEGNFRFCVAANCPPGIPFFPVGYAEEGSSPGFAIGTENDGVLHSAFKAACEDLEKAEQLLYDALTEALEPVQRIAERLERDLGVPYMHIDTSLAPGLDTPSMTDSFEALGIGPFGGPGTLAVCSLVTSVLKRIPVRKGGYCGLMLPVCEDAGLSKAAAEGHLRIADLLQYSCVCGCGLDTVPIQGYTGDPVEDRTVEQKIAGIIMDLTALAFRLDKPLSCRLLPQPGKKSGDKTTFQSPYLINSRVMVL